MISGWCPESIKMDLCSHKSHNVYNWHNMVPSLLMHVISRVYLTGTLQVDFLYMWLDVFAFHVCLSGAAFFSTTKTWLLQSLAVARSQVLGWEQRPGRADIIYTVVVKKQKNIILLTSAFFFFFFLVVVDFCLFFFLSFVFVVCFCCCLLVLVLICLLFVFFSRSRFICINFIVDDVVLCQQLSVHFCNT